jgi:uncharacterized protein YhjY with autotransporter beta-barrel domain
VTPDADQTHLFADDQHYTTAGQKILADYECSLLVAPSEISFLAEAPVKTRAAVGDSIFNQIAISERQRKAGTFNVWATGEAMSLAINSGATGFPSDPGTPAAGTAGIDYAIANGMIIGAAFSYGQTTQSFSLGGDFKQTDVAGSLYGAYTAGPYWARAIGTYGGLTYDVNRIVPIGITQQSNTGNTSGRNASFAAEFGYDFTLPLGRAAPTAPVMPLKAAAPAQWPLLTFGPVVGIVLQHITVNGYTETDPFAAIGGFTALSFGDQTRNSAVTELGYQAGLALGRWQPFTKLVWNHELASTDRSVTASLTTIVAPSYWMSRRRVRQGLGYGDHRHHRDLRASGHRLRDADEPDRPAECRHLWRTARPERRVALAKLGCGSRLAAEIEQHAIADHKAEDGNHACQREGVLGAAEQAHRQRTADLARAERCRHHPDRKRCRRAAEPQRFLDAGHGDDHEGAADAHGGEQKRRHVDHDRWREHARGQHPFRPRP